MTEAELMDKFYICLKCGEKYHTKPHICGRSDPCLAYGQRGIIGKGFTAPCSATSRGQHIFTQGELRGEQKIPKSM